MDAALAGLRSVSWGLQLVRWGSRPKDGQSAAQSEETENSSKSTVVLSCIWISVNYIADHVAGTTMNRYARHSGAVFQCRHDVRPSGVRLRARRFSAGR